VVNILRERVETLPPERDTVDLEALDEALAYIQAHPEQWDQGTWRCTTAMCVAGWVGELGGARWLTDGGGCLNEGGLLLDEGGHPVPPLWSSDLVRATGYTVVLATADACRPLVVEDAAEVREFARRRLGVTYPQAAELFSSDNSLADLLAMRDRLAADPRADLFLGQAHSAAEDGIGRERMGWEEL
jgi:hypothetical protein